MVVTRRLLSTSCACPSSEPPRQGTSVADFWGWEGQVWLVLFSHLTPQPAAGSWVRGSPPILFRPSWAGRVFLWLNHAVAKGWVKASGLTAGQTGCHTSNAHLTIGQCVVSAKIRWKGLKKLQDKPAKASQDLSPCLAKLNKEHDLKAVATPHFCALKA